MSDLLPLIPYRHTYVEPFGGGASVMLARHPSTVEVYNDLNFDLVNFFDIVRDPIRGEELQEMLEWTPYSHEEFKRAINQLAEKSMALVEAMEDSIRLERAWALFTRQNQGISGVPVIHPASWSRSKKDSMNTEKWRDRIRRFGRVRDRMRLVQVTNEDALDCIRRWDSPDTVFYLDPPYVLETRKGAIFYEKEYTDEQHVLLLNLLRDVQGPCVLSGYDHPIYDMLDGWERLEYEATAMSVVTDGLKPSRTEVVWRNPQARDQQTLF